MTACRVGRRLERSARYHRAQSPRSEPAIHLGCGPRIRVDVESEIRRGKLPPRRMREYAFHPSVRLRVGHASIWRASLERTGRHAEPARGLLGERGRGEPPRPESLPRAPRGADRQPRDAASPRDSTAVRRRPLPQERTRARRARPRAYAKREIPSGSFQSRHIDSAIPARPKRHERRQEIYRQQSMRNGNCTITHRHAGIDSA